MALLPSTFQERLQQMEDTRNQRLALLQAERDLQAKKYQLLSEKLSNLRRMEQRCLLLERRKAEVEFRILAEKSEIDALDAWYYAAAQEFRDLKVAIDELERKEREKDRFYELKRVEMEEFKEKVKGFVSDTRLQVQNLRNSVSELQATLKHLLGNDGYLNNPDIAAAEARKAELLATKENLGKTLASNRKLRELLQKQLQKMLISQGRGRSQPPATEIAEDRK